MFPVNTLISYLESHKSSEANFFHTDFIILLNFKNNINNNPSVVKLKFIYLKAIRKKTLIFNKFFYSQFFLNTYKYKKKHDRKSRAFKSISSEFQNWNSSAE